MVNSEGDPADHWSWLTLFSEVSRPLLDSFHSDGTKALWSLFLVLLNATCPVPEHSQSIGKVIPALQPNHSVVCHPVLFRINDSESMIAP